MAEAVETNGFVEVDGARIYYRERGTGPPVVLIHGTGANADCWGAALDDLAKDFRVIAYDRRSYSRSIAPPLNSVARHTDDLAALLRQLDAAPAALVGWSFGGAMSLRLAAQCPELVHAVVLVEPALPWLRCLAPCILAALGLARVRQLRGQPRLAVEGFERWAGGYRHRAGSGFDAQTEAARQVQIDNSKAALRELGMMPWQAISARAISGIGCPVALVVGDESPPWYARIASWISRLLPSAKLVRIPSAGHFVHIDAPEAFSSSVRQGGWGLGA